MRRHVFVFLGMASLGVAALGGCGGSEDPSETAAVFDSLRSLESAHHDASIQAENPAALAIETDRYGSSMHGLLDDMERVCDEMDGHDHMMNGRSMEGMLDLLSGMHGAVSDHHRRISEMGDLEAMRRECEEHHVEMAGMFHELGDMLGGAGGMNRHGM